MPTPDFIATLRAKVGAALLHVPTAGVLARDAEGRVLLVQDREDGQWTCPGGIVEPFETPAHAAVREAWEEAGVLVELTHIAGVFGGEHCNSTYANGDRISWVATIFAARVVRGTATADGTETAAARFASSAELPAMRLKEHLKLFLAAQVSGRPGYFEPPSWSPGAV
jgi:ADP-ribose pyrophosphatase YjhB (NUDIX family)